MIMHKEIKFVSAEEAVKVVKSGDHIHLSSVASAPRILIDALCARGASPFGASSIIDFISVMLIRAS